MNSANPNFMRLRTNGDRENRANSHIEANNINRINNIESNNINIDIESKEQNKENTKHNKRNIAVKAKTSAEYSAIEKKEEKIEDKYHLLKRKIHRPIIEEESSNNAVMTISVHPQQAKLPEMRKAAMRFAYLSESSKFSFKIDSPIPNYLFNFSETLKKKHQDKINLSIIKSNINLSMISKNFVITDRGIDCSQKTHNTHYISIGRQQVNDQGVRPNDIMLFPTDPSISRSHFKIYHKDYFSKQKEFYSKVTTMLKIAHGKSHSGLVNQEMLYHILKYISPVKKVEIEDNGTIYGTYVRVKAYSYREFMSSFLVNMKSKNGDDIFGDNYGIVQTLETFWYSQSQVTPMPVELISQKNSIRNLFSPSFDYASNPEDRANYENFLKFLQKGQDCKFWVKNSLLSDRSILFENNLIVNKFLPAVFLNNSRLGFIIVEIGNIVQIVEAMRSEYYEFNGEGFNNHIEVISLDKIFDFQKADCSSQTYKGQITKEELVHSLQYIPFINNYSILFFIETCGDPCGIMNRVSDVLFLHSKDGLVKNNRCFSFNYLKGFLIGNSPKSCFVTNSEIDTFLFFNHVFDKWIVTDITKFLNPSLYYSDDYFGLWICTSPDKKSNNRFQSKRFYVGTDDEIKVSETVMKVQITGKNSHI